MKNKLKAIQILEVMLDSPLNDKRIFDQSDDTVYNGEEWLHIDDAIEEIEALERKVQRLEAELKGKDLMLETYEKTVFQNRCETCVHYQEGKQPDGILWQSCDHEFECANIYEFHYKAKDEN